MTEKKKVREREKEKYREANKSIVESVMETDGRGI